MEQDNRDILSKLSSDIFLFNGFNVLLQCYLDNKEELKEEDIDSADYFISGFIDAMSKKLKNGIDQVI